ncbi:MAG: type I 3-dehydroquinate dehydratase [Phycisphaeraceae bacterium]|nr:MAG: type I 3-dehydroquinate dehydratase [Phycisphaeraceae bacterium]
MTSEREQARTLVCVPIMVEDVEGALRRAGEAADAGADLVEFRVDGLLGGSSGGGAGEGDVVAGLVSRCRLPCVVTCRSASEGGLYDGDDAERVAMYERVTAGVREGEHAPRYIDVEHAAYARSANLRQKVNLGVEHPGQVRGVSTGLVLSFHDFKERPADLSRRVLAMSSEPACAVVKVAYRARSLRDNLEAFEAVRGAIKPTIALAMGEFGLMSRVLAPKFGGFLTFASLAGGEETAPGQPSIGELLGQYRFRAIGRRTAVYGVIGWPVGHSMSPLVHNAGFGAVGFDGVYLPLPVASGGDAEGAYASFKASVLELVHDEHLDFRGASVTIPHKENLVRLARERGWALDAVSAGIGAGNTLSVERDGAGRFVSARVFNTDAPAVAACVLEAAGRSDLAGVTAAVIGAGGVGRAAAYALADAGARVVVFNRDLERAAQVASEVSRGLGGGRVVVAEPMGRLAETDAGVFVNGTPVGMSGGPDPGGCVIPAVVLEAGGNRRAAPIVLDTVYNPVRTPLLAAAGRAGWRTVDGVSMFVRQAEAQFWAWTGVEPPGGLFDRLVRERLALKG